METPFTAPISPTADSPVQVPGGVAQRPVPSITPPRSNPPLRKSAYRVDVDPKDPWEICLEFAKHYTKDVGLRKEEIYKLLIVAGLFSVVFAAFALVSYRTPHQAPADKAVLLLKSLLDLHLNGATKPQQNLSIGLDPWAPTSSAAERIAFYYSLSLVLSLSVLMVGIVCLQWVHKFGRNCVGSQREQLRVYYMRYRGLGKWHVFKVLAALPFVLFLSLLFFFAGLVELLAEVDVTCAIIPAVFVGITSMFLLITFHSRPGGHPEDA
ncbi:hypothetical protein D9756_002956 [Leucocoprinus leucothites]|uniref:DUF6535 domain-containing protein n=1 Tax=Leucocoprinus leucothites TaxID=201217 RepID=A0A8H5LJX0_9AGAR|nr:hypothetical protein D9756_002956 [Leucoagaricus leucothites]